MIINSPVICKKPSVPFQYRFADSFAPFGIGGISGSIATCLIQPIDTLKVQIQVTSQKLGKNKNKSVNIFSILKQIKRQKGLKILYTGIDSAILRQIFYGSVRLGSYNFTLQYYKNNGIKMNKMQKILLASISGVFGALVGNPFDVVLVRKQAAINSNVLQNNKKTVPYKNTLNAFQRMIVQQGLTSLWTGIKITILRVVLINIGQLASKQIISDELNNFYPTLNKFYRDNICAILASVLTSFISLPADNLKIKLQKQHKSNKVYSGILDCFLKSVKNQGFLRLWVGFWIYLVRGFPHSYILIRLQQFLTEMYENSKKNRIIQA